MKWPIPFGCVLLIACQACTQNTDQSSTEQTVSTSVRVVSAMKNVMWKGELEGKISLDTISEKIGLYGIGPLSYLQGEILILDGINYVSRIADDTNMQVMEMPDASAPFFVYANNTDWKEYILADSISSLGQIEAMIEKLASHDTKPFVFKLIGEINSAKIHVQNLSPGTQVSSPKEAHQGQVNFDLKNDMVEIVGFFSYDHQGIFTHHDSYAHMHLITDDKSHMGHLDAIDIAAMKLYLPKGLN